MIYNARFLLSVSGLLIFAAFSFYGKGLVFESAIFFILTVAFQTAGTILLTKIKDKNFTEGIEEGMKLQGTIVKTFDDLERVDKNSNSS